MVRQIGTTDQVEATFSINDPFADCDLTDAWCVSSYKVRVSPAAASGEYDVGVELTLEGIDDATVTEVWTGVSY